MLARLAGYARASAGCDEGRGFGTISSGLHAVHSPPVPLPAAATESGVEAAFDAV